MKYTKIFNVSEELDDDFWNEYLERYAKLCPPRRFASEVIQKLREKRNTIYIITARYLSSENSLLGEKMRMIVKNWLKEHKIVYDEIIFAPEDKLETCIEHNIDIMIDDKVENINKISTKIPVICFHANYNEKCVGKNITRCYSWYDILEKIEKMIHLK